MKKIRVQALGASILGLGLLLSPMAASVFAQEDDTTTTAPREADDDGNEGLWGLLGLLGLVGLYGLKRRDRVEHRTTTRSESNRP